MWFSPVLLFNRAAMQGLFVGEAPLRVCEGLWLRV